MNHIYRAEIPRDITVKLDVFDCYKFYEEGHYYTCHGSRVGLSMTKLIHDYSNPFDAEKIASKRAEKENKTTSEVLEEWRIENKFSTVKGSLCHLYAQEIWKGIEYEIDYQTIDDDVDKERLKKSFEAIKIQARKFYDDHKDCLVPIADEFIVGSEEYDIAGSIDNLFYNILTHEIVLVDYKTNKEIKYQGFRKATMLVPLQHLQDCNYIHYCIQLNGYQKLFEEKTGLKISEKMIVYFNEKADDYEIIEVQNLSKEVNLILENRRVKNMNSIPVLIIGKSGSGKSTSLRNFKNAEIGIINVTNKPLPFKSDLKYASSMNYQEIASSIKKTKKKSIVIDDASYLLVNDTMEKAKIKGYEKFTEMAQSYYELIKAAKDVGENKIVYFFMHEETDENGNIKPKTTGKMLDNQVCLEGLFTIVLRSVYEDGKYVFKTKTNGYDVTKTPMGMFSVDSIENDLKAVDKVIREYYELDKIEESEEK